MSRRRTRKSGTVALPWERRHTLWQRRFTLRELRPWLLGLGLLLTVFLVYRQSEHDRRVDRTRIAIAEAYRALSVFRAEMGRCPKDDSEFVHPPRSGARYLSAFPEDAFGRPLLIRCAEPGTDDASTRHASADAPTVVVSAGPSGEFSVDDNIL